MRFLPSACLLLLLATTACDVLSTGSPCGGTRQVDARLALPDTGVGAGGHGTVSFFESGPGQLLDETALIVRVFPPDSTSFADPPPRVRVISRDSAILLDQIFSMAYQRSWYAKQSVPPGPQRDAIVAAFAQERVTVEFVGARPNERVTRVQPTVSFAGTTPVLQCM